MYVLKMNFKNYIHLIQFILETKVILKKIPHKIVQYFTQCTNILKRLLVCVVVIMLIFGNLKDSLMKILQLLLHPIIILTPSYFGTKTRVELNWSCLKQDKIIYNHRKIVNICIVYEINKHFNISCYPVLQSCLFGAVSLT